MVKIDYGNILPPPRRKLRKIGGTNKPVTELVVKQEPTEDVEDGEVVDDTTKYVGLSEEDKKICEELYGDLV
jgi:hypothetical protein